MQPASSMDQQFIEKLTRIIEENLEKEDFGVEQLARELGMSRITLHRKVKATIKKSVSEFIRETRLKHAHRLLQHKTGTVSEIAFKVGFSSVPYFTRSFHKYYGYTPGEVLKGLHPPVDKNQKEKKKLLIRKKNILFVAGLAIVFSVYFIFTQSRNKPTLAESSIIIMTPEKENTDSITSWIFNGLYHELRNKLSNTGNIRVCSEYTARYYTNSENIIKESSRAGIDYIIKFESANTNDANTLYITLVDLHNDKLLLNEPFDVKEFTNDFFVTTENLTTDLINKIKGEISEEDKKVMAQKLTESPEASILYYKALDYQKRWDRREGHKYLRMAMNNLKKATEIDSTFSEAYVNLGWIYIHKLFPFAIKWPKRAHELLDSGLLMADLALKYDEKLGIAWALKYDYYEKQRMQDHPDAQKCFRMQYKYGDSETDYMGKFSDANGNFKYYDVIDYFYKYRETKPSEEVIPPWMLRAVIENLMSMDFPDVAKKYAYQLFLLENDTISYHELLNSIDIFAGNFTPSEKEPLAAYKKNPKSIKNVRTLINLYCNTQEYDEAYKYVLELEKLGKELNENTGFSMNRGQIYMIAGRIDAGKEQFEKIIEWNRELYNEEFSTAPDNKITFAIYAGAYASMGEKDKALKNMQKLLERKVYSKLLLNQMQDGWFYQNIRDEPEFKKVMNQLWENYYEEHNRIEKLLKKKGEI